MVSWYLHVIQCWLLKPAVSVCSWACQSVLLRSPGWPERLSLCSSFSAALSASWCSQDFVAAPPTFLHASQGHHPLLWLVCLSHFPSYRTSHPASVYPFVFAVQKVAVGNRVMQIIVRGINRSYTLQFWSAYVLFPSRSFLLLTEQSVDRFSCVPACFQNITLSPQKSCDVRMLDYICGFNQRRRRRWRIMLRYFYQVQHLEKGMGVTPSLRLSSLHDVYWPC